MDEASKTGKLAPLIVTVGNLHRSLALTEHLEFAQAMKGKANARCSYVAHWYSDSDHHPALSAHLMMGD
ncbi:hypothetical protein G3545_01420 [Starkeya sp. ORNL1]|uniref:hypothetical protein n=1 Tax=Starkeya sp. ORNL1 TaxID=2709380 RepID=UPI0014638464|nr:hypothetical protein [Starkeya sp. ORNL1]QJP12443.1 hypothetical protein G3545_01420 [Starkeya sp. ORNL1]